MKSEVIEYQCNEKKFQGILYEDETITGVKPGVIVAHAWRGRDTFAEEKAKMLASLGYIGFAADLYGDGKSVETNEDAFELMLPLFLTRSILRERIEKAYDVLKSHKNVDKNKIGAIGFCFGGTTVIELLRSGKDLRGIVTFHGLLGYILGEHKAKAAPSAESLHGKLLLLHGYHDPMVSQKDLLEIQNELTEKKVDWQLHIYGEATHAFTNPQAQDAENGMLYNENTEKRAMHMMRNFFEEVFA